MTLRAALVTALLALAACSRSVSPGDGARPPDDAVVALDAVADVARPDAPPDAPPDVPAAATIGRRCRAPSDPMPVQADCEPGQLCLGEQHGFPGGYCVQSCSGGACPAESVCVGAGGFPLCLRRCTTAGDCRASEGYVCNPGGPDGARVCVPSDGPVGQRDGGACYTTAAGPNQRPPLARRAFAGPNLSASAERDDSVAEAEGNVVASPRNASVAVSYIAQSRGMVFMGASTTSDGMTVVRTGASRDPENPANSDPVLVYTRDGRLHMVYLGFRYNGGMPTGMRLRYAVSTDDGRSFGAPRAIEPAATCTYLCDKPWIVAGPAPGDPSRDNLYVGWLVQRNAMSAELVVIRSEDDGATWSPPVTFARLEAIFGSVVAPNLVTFAVGADGALHAVYDGLRIQGGGQARYGDGGNRVLYRRSGDGGRTWAPIRRVSRATDAPVYNQPVVAVDGEAVHVAYVTGSPTGAWDVILATSTDGGVSFVHRKVNDEPDSCATHAFPWMVADTVRHVVHVTWLENRFGEGALAYAACPGDAGMPCGANEQVSDRPFTFATSRDPSRWHGDYQGLVLAPSGDLWAAWSDPRTGAPAMYLARARVR